MSSPSNLNASAMKKADHLRFDSLPADARGRLKNALVANSSGPGEQSLREYAQGLQEDDPRSAAILMVASDLLNANWKLIPSSNSNFSLEKPPSEKKRR